MHNHCCAMLVGALQLQSLNSLVEQLWKNVEIISVLGQGWAFVSHYIVINKHNAIYKMKICWNKGGIPLVLLEVRLVFWVYSPSSSLPDYRLCVTGPRIFTRAQFVCKVVPERNKNLRICKVLYGWYLTGTTLRRNRSTLCIVVILFRNKMDAVKT